MQAHASHTTIFIIPEHFFLSNKWLVQRWASQAMSKSKAFKVIQSQSNDYCFIIIWTNHIQEASFLYICQSTLHVLVVILWESAGSTVLLLWRDKYQLSLQRPWWPSPHDFPFSAEWEESTGWAQVLYDFLVCFMLFCLKALYKG